MMLVTLVLSWMLLSRVAAHWNDGRVSSETKPHTGFYTKYMTCNDAGTVCVACYLVRVYKEVYLNTIEYAEGPTMFKFRGSAETRDWVLSFVQDDSTEPFRQCMMQSESTDWDFGGNSWRFSICIDNNFSNVYVPPECLKPLGVVTMVSLLGNEEAFDHQILYCAA